MSTSAGQELVIDGTPFQRAGDLSIHWEEAGPAGGPRRGLVAWGSVCPDPDCPCHEVNLALSEVGPEVERVSAEGRGLVVHAADGSQATPAAGLRANLDLESGWLEARGPDVPALRERYQALVDQGLLQVWRERWFEVKGHRVEPWESQDWSYLADGQTLLPWLEIASGNPDFVRVRGKLYGVVESYCALATCPCDEVAVDVLQFLDDPETCEEVRTTHVGLARIALKTGALSKVSAEGRTTRAEIEAVLAAYVAEQGLERARRRKRRVEEIGDRILTRSFDQQRAARPPPVVHSGPRVAPNDRCPCGSGKKHKRCCGAK